jgi:hypothetical protein
MGQEGLEKGQGQHHLFHEESTGDADGDIGEQVLPVGVLRLD